MTRSTLTVKIADLPEIIAGLVTNGVIFDSSPSDRDDGMYIIAFGGGI